MVLFIQGGYLIIKKSMSYPPKFYNILTPDWFRLTSKFKGQLISKGLFGILNSSKTNAKNQLNYYDTSGRLFFVRFLEEFEDTKKTFRN